MRIIFFLLFAIFSFSQVNGQLMQGKWEGTFTDNGIEFPIKLEFILNSDSSYKVYSYSGSSVAFLKQYGVKFPQAKDTQTVCKVFYKFTPPNKVYLEEIEAISPSYETQDCFQKMYLKVKKRKKNTVLFGRWESICGGRNSTGEISFVKLESN